MKKVYFYCGKVDSQGGSKISLLNIIFLLQKEKINFEVFVNKRGWFTEKLDSKGINYTIIKEPAIIEKLNKKTNLFIKIVFLAISLPKLLINWIKVNKKISNGSKVVLNENRDLVLFLPSLFRRDVEVIQWIRSEYIGKVTKLIMRKANKIIAVSDVVKENIIDETNKPVYRIHNFMFDKPLKINKKSIDSNVINIAMVGSIQKIKGQLDAVKVLNHLKNDKKIDKIIKLHIIGREFDKTYTKRVKDYVKQNGLENDVKFLGHIDNVTDYLNNYIHLTLIPSQTESFCRVAMESISVGIPVIAYKVGGLKEVIIDDVTGMLVEKNDIKSMSASVKEILSNQELYKTMSYNAIKDWELRFYSESIKKQIFDVLV